MYDILMLFIKRHHLFHLSYPLGLFGLQEDDVIHLFNVFWSALMILLIQINDEMSSLH